ncbi:hypothetical protein M472_14995 [Sphingobacterium paucimobilis HER1398]|uniref:Thiamine pyrophosphokinase n=2 Tax=Sphingobacterium TaxID=28453 RepID=U2J579_9SPHI|nr:hypothetical protein M472_14995 [Sphingobacterium paucimobilis HER1398]
MVDQLLEWSPTIITDDYNLDFLLSEEIKVDVVFSTPPNEFLQEQISFLPLNGSFLDSALSYLISKSYPAVNILCTEIEDSLVRFAEDINIVAFCKNKRYVFVRSYYEKWKPKGEAVYVDPKCLESQEGLRLVGEQSFETENDGFFRLFFCDEKFVCVGEDI